MDNQTREPELIIDRITGSIWLKSECDESMLVAFPDRYKPVRLSDKAKEQFAIPSPAHTEVTDTRVWVEIPTEKEINKAVKELGEKSTAPDKETPDWMQSDIRRGIKWALSKINIYSEVKINNGLPKEGQIYFVTKKGGKKGTAFRAEDKIYYDGKKRDWVESNNQYGEDIISYLLPVQSPTDT